MYHSLLLAGWVVAQSDTVEATRGCYGTILNYCLLIVANAKQNLHILRLKFYSKTYIS